MQTVPSGIMVASNLNHFQMSTKTHFLLFNQSQPQGKNRKLINSMEKVVISNQTDCMITPDHFNSSWFHSLDGNGMVMDFMIFGPT